MPFPGSMIPFLRRKGCLQVNVFTNPVFKQTTTVLQDGERTFGYVLLNRLSLDGECLLRSLPRSPECDHSPEG